MTGWDARTHLRPVAAGPGAGGSLTLETQGRVGAAPTTPGRAGTARQLGPGKRDGKVYVRNQWWNPLKRQEPARTWWMGAGRQQAAAPCGGAVVSGSTLLPSGRRSRGILRRTRDEAAGEKLGTASVNRSVVNMGTIPGPPSPPASQVGDGQARRQLLAPGGTESP